MSEFHFFIEQLNQMPPALLMSMVAFVSLCVGSFLNVEIVRRPKLSQLDICDFFEHKFGSSEALLQKRVESEWASSSRSECVSCHSELSWFHNIPLFSYLALGGKCGFCKEKISIQYPMVELCTLVTSCISFGFLFDYTLSLAFAVYFFLLCVSIILCVIDIKDTEIYDLHNTLVMIAATLLLAITPELDLNAAFENAVMGLVGFLVFLAVFSWVRKLITKEDVGVMGAGDVPLIFCAIMWGVGLDYIEDGLTLLFMISVSMLTFGFTVLTRFLIMNDRSMEIPAAPTILVAMHTLIWAQLGFSF
ncbi:A24 family peptidase [Vibrio sp. D431a]|uniref:prepilin peptidase n=1 Tax=Vibrio sp. D431a TaxID=2837388 RepID=UPI002554BACA|nr:A24 family peptidase [Vibrio sp. D431a]MDK9790691.1 A24 family peptidase [Vibrio sp. D431a]